MGVLVGVARRWRHLGHQPAIGGIARPLDAPPWHPTDVVAPPSRFYYSTWWLVCSTCQFGAWSEWQVGPWIHVKHHRDYWSTNPRAWLWLVEEALPRITDVARRWGGAAGGQAVPHVGLPPPVTSHLLLHFKFVPFLAIFHHISYIQIKPQAQVELGKIQE
jgi:hypothetical protein